LRIKIQKSEINDNTYKIKTKILFSNERNNVFNVRNREKDNGLLILNNNKYFDDSKTADEPLNAHRGENIRRSNPININIGLPYSVGFEDEIYCNKKEVKKTIHNLISNVNKNNKNVRILQFKVELSNDLQKKQDLVNIADEINQNQGNPEKKNALVSLIDCCLPTIFNKK